jgi:hypothetical protein
MNPRCELELRLAISKRFAPNQALAWTGDVPLIIASLSDFDKLKPWPK